MDLCKQYNAHKSLTIVISSLGVLVAQSSSHNQGIDINNLLNYPLSAVSLPLSTADGAKRKTVKSMLFDAAIDDLDVLEFSDLPHEETLYTYFLDFAAAIRSFCGKMETVRERASKILSSIARR